jgi:hypothetical protein
MVVYTQEHYLCWPKSQQSAAALLLLRYHLIQWSQRADIAIEESVINGEFRVSLPRPRHYTQFVLEWTGPEFMLIGRGLLS